MEQTETDLINKRITQEMLNRQQEILTRLLESEKAEKKREFEEKRESRDGKEIPHNTPAKYLFEQKKKEAELEMLKTVPPSLTPFYKNKVNEYFLRSGNVNNLPSKIF